MPEENKNQKQKANEINTFPIKFALGEIKENINITTDNNSFYQISKEEIINQAFKFHGQGNIQEAIKSYQYFITQGFKDPRVFSNYGMILKGLGKSKEAEGSLRKAIEIKPDFAQAHYNLGCILRDLDKLKEAELSITKAIDLNPNFAEAHSSLGNILRDLGKLEEAEISQRKAIEIKPDTSELHLNLGATLRSLGKLEEAEISLRKTIQLKPDFADQHYILGSILKDLGKLEEAKASFKKAIKLKFGFNQAHDGLATVLEQLGQKKEAEDSAKRVLYLQSTNDSDSNFERGNASKLFKSPSSIEHSIFYRPGMGTENVGGFLRSMVMMQRPKRILEIGAGYTTPFLLEGLISNERVFDDGNLSESYFENYIYDPKLIVIDRLPIDQLSKVAGMNDILNSKYINYIEGDFQGKAETLFREYGYFDFVWFDCGAESEYTTFFKELWQYCSDYIFFHFTYLNGKPNIKNKIIRENINENSLIFDLVEPHKKRQGSVTIVKKQNSI